jgi:hypothetical protein
MTDLTYAGLRLAGNPLGTASPDAFGSMIGSAPSQMTPGYTGGFDYTTISGIQPRDAALFGLIDRRDERAYDRELKAVELMKQQRKEEAQEAFKMKMVAAIPGQILQGFESAARLSYPAAALQIQANTPALLAGVYQSNPFAGKRLLS